MSELLIKKVKTINGQEIDVLIGEGQFKVIGKNIRARAKKTIDGRGQIIAPGFFNLHTHAAMTLLRGYAEDMELNDWLTKKIWPKEAKLTAEDIYWGTKLAVYEMLKSGAIFFNDMYWHPEAAMAAVEEAGSRALIGLTMIDSHPLGSRATVEKNWQKLKNRQTARVKLAIAPHAIYTVSTDNLKWAADFARKNKLLIHLHLSETKQEISDCLKKHRCRPTEYLEKIGLLGPNVILAHNLWLDKKEIAILARHHCSVVYNPTSNMKLGLGIMPFAQMKKAKLNICLGTDGAASNNNLDMIEGMKIGDLLQKLNGQWTISAADLFNAATKNGARASGLKNSHIKSGAPADFILINTERLDFLPGFNFLNDLIYSATAECVEAVVVNGRILMENRRIAGEKKLIKEIKKRYGKK